MVAGDVGVVRFEDGSLLMGEGVPDRRFPPALGDRALYLESGGGDAPKKVFRKAHVPSKLKWVVLPRPQ